MARLKLAAQGACPADADGSSAETGGRGFASGPARGVREPRLNRRVRAIALLAVLVVAMAAILVAGLAMSPDAYKADFMQKSLAPSAQHLFGTDFQGHDMFARSIRGLALSTLIGLFASFISGVTAVTLGSLSAICGGWVDKAVLWLADLFMAIPHLVLLILVSFAMGGGVAGVVTAVAVTHWPALTRLIRAEVLRIRTSDYVHTSRQFGKSNAWIATHHVFPNVFPQFVVGTILLFPHAILHESALTFLGFGLPLDSPAIGAILSDAMKYISTGSWWLAFFPGLMLVVLVLLAYALGDDLKKLTDPRTAQE